MAKEELEKELAIAKSKLEQAETCISTLKQTIDEKDKQMRNLELIYTRKSMSLMDGVKTLYRLMSLELEDQK